MTTRQGTHFWFMTLRKGNPDGTTSVLSLQGTRTPGEGSTRLDQFNSIRAEIDELTPAATGAVVIAFDIQPNEI